MRLRDDKIYRQRVWRIWLPAETWATVLTLPGLIDGSLCPLDATKFNAAMIWSKQLFDEPAMDRLDGTNQSGIFHVRFQMHLYYIAHRSIWSGRISMSSWHNVERQRVSMAADVMSAIVESRSSMTSLFAVMTFKDKLLNSTWDKSSRPSKTLSNISTRLVLLAPWNQS